MFLVARALPARSPGPIAASPAAGLRDSGSDPLRRQPPAPDSFLEPAAGGTFSLMPRRPSGTPGALVQAGLPDPLLASLLPSQPRLRLALDLPPVPALPAAAPRRRSA